jgi:predicted transposase YdaD
LFESAEIATFTPQEKIKLEFDMRTERDLKNQIAYAKKEGREEGREDGREEGREEERIRIVENLRKLGISEEKIASAIEAK